jgi:sec-independent protein translocase protein TatC
MRVIPRFRRRGEDERAGTMSVMDHLEELRHRLIVCIYAVAAGSLVGWFLYGSVVNLIRNPFCAFVRENPDVRPPTGCDLVFTSPVEGMITKVKVVVFLGLLVALPVVMYQLWAFIAPGLTAKEKKYSVPFVTSAVALFALGATIAYVTLPKALQFILGFAGPNIVPLLSFGKYVGFVVLVTLAFGVSFLFPVVLVALELVGVIPSTRLRAWRRYALLFIVTFAAIITPSGDPWTLLAMSIPMYVFYEAAIVIGRWLGK